jgi:NADH:ubiquinone oxidoreductase subunit 3 (subunit A)
MDPKGKGMVVSDKEKESIFNEPRDDKPTDSGSSHKKDRKKKRRIKKIVYYDNDKSSSSPRDDDEKKKPVNSNYYLIILVFLSIPILICFQFLLVNLHTLMERTTLFGVTKCVVTYFLSILVYGR